MKKESTIFNQISFLIYICLPHEFDLQNAEWRLLEGLHGGYKCQLSVKIPAIYQFSVKF